MFFFHSSFHMCLLIREFILLAAKYEVERLWCLAEMQDLTVYLLSSTLGIMTTLSECTLPNGHVGLAHFTQQGQFYRTALENEGPVAYFCDVLVSRGAFEINTYMLSCLVAHLQVYPTKGVSQEEVGWLFTLKKLQDIPIELRVEYVPQGR